MKLLNKIFGSREGSTGRAATGVQAPTLPLSHSPTSVQPAPTLHAPRSDARVLAPPIRVTVGPSNRRSRGRRMYQAAQVTRLTSDWPITLTSANAEILVSAIALRSRLRELERDDDYFRQMLWILENNVVGHRGLQMIPKLKNADGEYNQDEIAELRKAWHRYLKRRHCTVTGAQSGVELQRMAVRALARDGALLLRIHRGFPNAFGFAVEPLEIDRLDFFWTRPQGQEYGSNEIQFGVEMDRFKRPLFYHILTRHPGDVFAWRNGAKYREKVPAQDIIAIWTIERAGQYIGMPLWPSVGNRLNQMHKYEEAELVAARVAAAKGGWFKKTNENSKYEGPEDQAGNKIMETEPGQWEELPIGWDPVQNNPQHPTDAFPDYIKSQLRGASSGANLPYNSVANDLEGVNYSSIRAGLLEARDGYKYLQELVNEVFMEQWFEAWLPYAILSGQVKKIDLSRTQEISEATKWRGRRWGWVDPLNDTRADAMGVELGFTSRRRVIAESAEGGDIEEIFEELEEDKKLAEKHGLKFGTFAPKGDAKPPEAE